MTNSLKKGDEVTWDTSQGETEGKVVKMQTSDTKIRKSVVKASKSDPQVIVGDNIPRIRVPSRSGALANIF